MIGKLIIFEGPDGVGKTTIAKEVAKVLSATGLNVKSYSFPGKHSPGTLGHHIYDLHHNKEKYGIQEMCPESLQILHIAAHIDLLKRCIIPDLENGNVVILDRFWWSTMVYGLVAGCHSEFMDDLCEVEINCLWKHVVCRSPFIFLIHGEYRRDNPPENFDFLVDTYHMIFNSKFGFGHNYLINNDDDLESIVYRIISILGNFICKRDYKSAYFPVVVTE